MSSKLKNIILQPLKNMKLKRSSVTPKGSAHFGHFRSLKQLKIPMIALPTVKPNHSKGILGA